MHGVAHSSDGDVRGGIWRARLRRRPEKAAEQHTLGVAGVLVFVEHDHTEALPLAAPHHGMPLRYCCGQGHLLTKGDDPAFRHLLFQLSYKGKIVESGELSVPDFQHGSVEFVTLPGAFGEFVKQADKRLCFGFDVGGANHVAVHLADQGDETVSDGAMCDGCVDIPRVVSHHIPGDLVQLGGSDHAGGRFHGEKQPVLADDAPGVGVVGGDRGGDGLQVCLQFTRGIKVCKPRDSRQGGQARTDALGKLLRGLFGKRQPQYLVRRGKTIGHEPHHASRHGFGFPGPRAGHHQQRAGLVTDHIGLLLRGQVLLAQPPRQ